MTRAVPQPEVDLRAAERRATDQPTLLMDPRLNLHELAQLADMTPRNVRAYQQRNLLPPGRRDGRRLVYDWTHVARLRLIRALHSRGLSLKVIEDLIARGAAEDELARISQEATPGWDHVKVPIGGATLDLLSHGPHTTSELLEAGVLHVEDGELVANSAALGVAGALLAAGMDLTTICRIVLAAGRAGQESSATLHNEVEILTTLSPSTAALAARLAAIVFNEQFLDEARRHHAAAPCARQGAATPLAAESAVVADTSLAPILPRQL